MKSLLKVGLAAVFLTLSAACAFGAEVVDIQGEKPAKVQMTDLVRVTGHGIAGAQITVEVKGDGKLDQTYELRKVRDGHTIIGASITEFLIRPTGRGKINAKVTVRNPAGGNTVEKYEIVVE